MTRAAAIVRRVVFGGLIAAFLYGFYSHHLFSQAIWTPLGRRRLIEFAIVSAVLSAAIYFWRPGWLFSIAAGMAALYGIAVVGVQGPATVIFVLFSAWLLGRALMRTPEQSVTGRCDEILATLAGVCCYAALVGFAVFFRINNGPLYFSILSVPLVWRRREIGRCARAVLAFFGLKKWNSSGAYAAAALLTCVLFAQWLMLLKPENSADGLSVHMMAPAWVAAHHRWDFEFQRLIWAVLPMNGDWAYTIAYVMGGEYAARLLNFSIFALMTALQYTVIRRWTSLPAAALLVAAFASCPLAQMETGSLFVDNFWAAALFAAIVALVRARETAGGSHLILACLFLGSAMATKPGTAAYFLPVAAFIVVEAIRRERRGELRPAPVMSGAACLLFIALPPYVNAWVRTGNPVYPYLNTVFHSPYFDQVTPLRDYRFHTPLSWRTLFDMTFSSHNFFEGQDGGFAFQYLLLVPLCALYVRRNWSFAAWAGLIAGLFGFIATFANNANLRYIYPALPLMLLPVAAAVSNMDDTVLRRGVYSALACAVALNVWFLGASTWYHEDFYLNALFNKHEIERYTEETCPVRRLVEYLNLSAPDAPVAFFASEEIAGLRGPAWTNSWHSPVFEKEMESAATARDVLEVANTHGIEYFVAALPSNSVEKMSPAVWGFLGEYTRPEYSYGGYYVARLSSPHIDGAGGKYADSSVHYSPGDWVRDSSDSTMVAGKAGAELRIDFTGRQVTIIFAKGPDHGQATVSIDGKPRGLIEQYFPSREPDRIKFGQRTAGAHALVLRVLPSRHYASSGNLIDIAHLIVE